MKKIRAHIENQSFAEFAEEFLRKDETEKPQEVN
jgi:queuine/archaeosine tRNA-ribosyltransferase